MEVIRHYYSKSIYVMTVIHFWFLHIILGYKTKMYSVLLTISVDEI